ncbi:MAG: AsmA family protein [Thalassospira sp.]|nr:AsmA family protein [Thalassospira sp.]
MQPSHAPHLILPSRSWVGRVLLLFGLIGLAFGALWLAANSYLTPERLRTLLVEHVATATGRTLTLDGDVRVHVGLEPRVELGAISLSNAPGMQDALMLKAERMSVAVDAIQLLFGTLVLTEVTLDTPELFLERNAAGVANWDIRPTQKAGKKQAAALENSEHSDTAATNDMPPLLFQRLVLSRAKIVLREAEEPEKTILLDRLSVDANSMNDPIRAEVSGSFDNVPFSVKGILGPFAVIAAGDGKYPFAVQSLLGAMEWATTGELQLKQRRVQAITAALTAKVSQLQNLSTLLNHPFPDGLDGKITATLQADSGGVTISEFNADFRDKGRLNFSGNALGDWRRGAFTGGTITGQLEAGSLSALAALLNIPLVGEELVRVPFNVSYAAKDQAIKAEISSAQLGANSFTAQYNRTSQRATVAITDARFDARSYAPKPAALPAAGTLGTAQDNTAKKAEQDAFAAFWKSRSRLADEATLSAKSVILMGEGADPLALENVEARFVSSVDATRITLNAATRGDGKLSLDVAAVPAAAKRSAQLSIKSETRLANAAPLIATLTGVPALDSGNGAVLVDVSGNATTVDSFRKSLSGSLQILSEQPQLNKAWVSSSIGLLGDAATVLLKGTSLEKASCVAVRLQGDKGQFNSRVAALDSRDVVVVAEGNVNIGSERVDMLLTPYGKTPDLAALVGSIRLSGAFSDIKTSAVLPGLTQAADGTIRLSGQAAGALVNAAGSLLGNKSKLKLPGVAAIPENLCSQLLVRDGTGQATVAERAALSFHKGGAAEKSEPVRLENLMPKGKELLKKFLP